MEYKVVADQKNKLVKIIMSGKAEAKVWEEAYKETLNELRKLPKGEGVVLANLSDLDTRLMTPETAKTCEEWNAIIVPLCKKWATVVPSFMLQKSLEHELTPNTNVNRFITELEALKWLLE